MTYRKTALVTGGAARIGAAICERLAEMGFQVIIHYRGSYEKACLLVDKIDAFGGEAELLQADLMEDVQDVIARARNIYTMPISLLVNNASVFENDSIADFSSDSFDAHMQTHVKSPAILIQDFIAQPELSDLDAPQIINIIDQRVKALTPKFFSYTLSKATMWTMTQTLAQELGPIGVRMNAIGPGPTLKNIRQSDADWQAQNDALILGQGPSPEDIAQAVDYLIHAKAVTGQLIAVDGGQHLAWETPDVMVNE